MLAISARVVPHIMRAGVSWLCGVTETWLPSTLVSTRSDSFSCSSPSRPLAVNIPAAIATCTPCGISTGYLPTRDMPPLLQNASEHAAEDFAADIGSAGLRIAHHATRRGQDGDAEAGIDPRQLLDLRIDAAARLGDPVDLLDDRLAFIVLQLDAQLRHAGAQFLGREAADIALATQHIQHVGAQLRRRRHAHRVPRALRIANP